MSISDIIKDAKRGRGRPATGAIPVLVRLMPDDLARLDVWMASAGHKGHPAAIRELIRYALPPIDRTLDRA